MRRLWVGLVVVMGLVVGVGGCGRTESSEEVVVYCGVDEPYASKVFAAFEKETGVRVAVQYDIESSKSVGLAGKLEAEKEHPRADVWWGSEAFLSVRLANEGILEKYEPSTGGDVPAAYRGPRGCWTGVGLRARVLAVGEGKLGPGFAVKGLEDLADPRLKGKVAMSRPTAGATGAHLAAMYATWGVDRTRDFLKRLHDNRVELLGGNAEVADQVGAGVYALGLTDSDDISNTLANGGKESMVVPDQGEKGEGTMVMPSTVGVVKGAGHEAAARKLVDYLVSKAVEDKLIALGYARWSVRAGTSGEGGIKGMEVDYEKAAEMFPRAQREATAILEGRAIE